MNTETNEDTPLETALGDVTNRSKLTAEYKADRQKWGLVHGSERLKRCIQEEVDYNGIYINERLALEYPGWIRYTRIEGMHKRNVVNPTMDHFHMLDKARETLPNAKFAYFKVAIVDQIDYKGFVAIAFCDLINEEVIFGLPDDAIVYK